jgi:hypothetical protein
MASFDLGSITAYKFAFADEVTANVNTGTVDTQGFEGVAIVTSVGTSNINAETNPISVTFFESNLSNGSDATAVDAKFVDAQAITASNTAFWASVKPAKRYVFARYIISAAVGANVHTIGSLGFAQAAPTK